MTSRLDHLTVVATSLKLGAAYVEAALGVAPEAGRTHASMGTHNLLLALGPSAYLEVISKNPQAGPVTRPRWFGLDQLPPHSAPRLAAWVAGTDDIAGATDSELGEVETMHREAHSWQMTVRADGAQLSAWLSRRPKVVTAVNVGAGLTFIAAALSILTLGRRGAT